MELREMDARVAEKVMGWPGCEDGLWSEGSHPSHGGRVRWCDHDSDAIDIYNDTEVWSPTTSVDAAFAVLERMRELGWKYSIIHAIDGPASVCFIGKRGPFLAEDAFLPLAISKAALAAVEGEGK